ncbi:hypothetical protein AB0Y02_14630 [Phocaeicola dorei]|uniref:hypothetical protein n=1 Tax=Phocaeicola dorei TaxID=357276 RepID=UPI003F292AF9
MPIHLCEVQGGTATVSCPTCSRACHASLSSWTWMNAPTTPKQYNKSNVSRFIGMAREDIPNVER